MKIKKVNLDRSLSLMMMVIITRIRRQRRWAWTDLCGGNIHVRSSNEVDGCYPQDLVNEGVSERKMFQVLHRDGRVFIAVILDFCQNFLLYILVSR